MLYADKFYRLFIVTFGTNSMHSDVNGRCLLFPVGCPFQLQLCAFENRIP